MNFKLEYEGAPGNIAAELLQDGTVIASESGLADRRAVEKWGARAARDHKVENTPVATARHEVAISGTKTFTL